MAYEITLEGNGEGVLITLLGSVEPEEHIEAIRAANKGGRLASVGPSVYPGAEQAFRRIIGGWIPDGLEMANFDDIDEARDWAATTA